MYWDDTHVPVLKLNNGTLIVESNYFHNVSNAVSVKQQTPVSAVQLPNTSNVQ